jgi:predicted glycosyltransferase involved in capsule biosynthesis
MLLSILIPGKNDQFRKNSHKTLQFNLEQIVSNIKTLGVNDIELILCDWGSDTKIIDDVCLYKDKNFKCVYVPSVVAQKYNGNGNYSIVHPINTAFRRSSGKYVIFWDSDCFVRYQDFVNLYKFVKHMDNTDDMAFYWGSRINLPYETYYNMINAKELSDYLEVTNAGVHEPLRKEYFEGTSISILMNRHLWEDSTGWFEKLIYWGWQDIEFHNRLCTKYKYGGDLYINSIKFYHLCDNSITVNNSHKFINPRLNSTEFKANPENWGLRDEILEIIQ